MDGKKVVFFDIDGTIWDYTNYIPESTVKAIRALRAKGNYAFLCSGRCRSYIQNPSLFEIGFDGSAFEDYFRKRLFYSAVPEDGAEDLLEYLSGKYTLCAVSNGPYEQQINRLRVGKMIRYFSHCFISSQIGAQKP